MSTLILRPKAQVDLEQARRRFDVGDGQMAKRFEEDVDRTFSYIIQFPQGFQERKPPFRFAPLGTFRYSIIYSIEEDDIIVYRVRHMHQRPIKRYFGG
jgi:plasmid stabilization system protein ParE